MFTVVGVAYDSPYLKNYTYTHTHAHIHCKSTSITYGCGQEGAHQEHTMKREEVTQYSHSAQQKHRNHVTLQSKHTTGDNLYPGLICSVLLQRH